MATPLDPDERNVVAPGCRRCPALVDILTRLKAG
jgi:hypothetical protein